MPDPARLYTPAEASAVSGLALKGVNNVIDKRIMEVARPVIAGGRGTRRYLTSGDLLFLRIEHGLAGRLPVERRQSLFRELAAKPDAETLNADDLLIVDIGAARRQVAERVRDLEEAEGMVHIDNETMGGEPVFKGTRIPVRAVAAMIEAGVGEDELLEGYPKLDRRRLSLARLWATAHPRRGRPKQLSDFGFTLKSSTRRPLLADPLPSEAAGASKST